MNYTCFTWQYLSRYFRLLYLLHLAGISLDTSDYYVLSVSHDWNFSRYLYCLFRPPDIPEILWFEEENDLIRSCAVLSSALGLQKSFSTSDISQLSSPEDMPGPPVRSAVSNLVLSSVQRTGYILDHPRSVLEFPKAIGSHNCSHIQINV